MLPLMPRGKRMVDSVTSHHFHHRGGTLQCRGKLNVPGIQFECVIKVTIGSFDIGSHALFRKQMDHVTTIPSSTCH